MRATRRDFLRLGATAAGLTLTCDLGDLLAAEAPPAAFSPNAYLEVATDGTVTLWVTRLEMGQGVRTLLPMILAEELDADWARVRIEQASTGGRYADVRLHTSGSGSSSAAYRTLRGAAAAARWMLLGAAAAAWEVDPATCRTEPGAVLHPPSGRRRGYGELAAAAARRPVPDDPPLKDPSTWRILGHPTRRVDGPAIVTGSAGYGLDVRVPGMLVASIERAPAVSATLGAFDGAAALRVPGVRRVLPVDVGIHPGVAVVGDDTWAALRGRAALTVEWKPGPAADFDSERYLAGLPAACEAASFPVRHEGDAAAALATAARRHEATYLYPFQAHAPLEPMNCTADVRESAAEIWAPTQTDVRTLAQVARVTGLPESAITLHPTLMGGGFGRRLFADYAAEAAALSQAVGRPVQVVWTRQDDMRCGYFQPATAQRFTAGLDADGAPVALVHRTSASDLTIYDLHEGRNIWTGPPKPPRPPDGYAEDQSPWGAYDNPYRLPHLRVDCADVTSPVPTGPWRAVEYPSTVFGRESFLDELAHLAGRDPIDYRLALLPDEVATVGPFPIDRGRLAAVLRRVRERSGWTTPLPRAGTADRRRGRGVAANVYHAGSYLAMVAEVSVAPDRSELRVDRITAVVDCGRPLNPLGIAGQTESGIAWGLSATLLGKVDFVAGTARQTNYGDFAVLRLDAMPELDVEIVPSEARPGGFGEHAVPPVAPAVANALFAATGVRLRRLPLTARALGAG